MVINRAWLSKPEEFDTIFDGTSIEGVTIMTFFQSPMYLAQSSESVPPLRKTKTAVEIADLVNLFFETAYSQTSKQ